MTALYLAEGAFETRDRKLAEEIIDADRKTGWCLTRITAKTISRLKRNPSPGLFEGFLKTFNLTVA